MSEWEKFKALIGGKKKPTPEPVVKKQRSCRYLEKPCAHMCYGRAVKWCKTDEETK